MDNSQITRFASGLRNKIRIQIDFDALENFSENCEKELNNDKYNVLGFRGKKPLKLNEIRYRFILFKSK